MVLEVNCRGRSYEIQTHLQGFGGSRYAAANVKLHSWPNPGPEHQKKLEEMREAGWLSETQWDQEQAYAWEDAASYWWEWAGDKAKDWGLGKIYSAGRSGGWLVLNDYPESVVESLQEGARGYPCDHCREYYDAHAKGKCLYGPTSYESDYEPDRLSQARLLKIIRFLKQCERSVKLWAGADYAHQLEFRIDLLWEAFQAERSESEDAA